ncbi:MAG: hypothetical protein HQL46_03015 [Gammaproteobacteria bacterium]|nr:hypothetical protein [Gammaproteobacteria bacterium]
MKTKNISSALHNFGDSFLSLMNYEDNGYVVDDLANISVKGADIKIDWINADFYPSEELTSRIKKSIEYYHSNLKRHFQSQDVELNFLKEIILVYPYQGRKYMWARDINNKEYKIYIHTIN